MTGSKRNGQGTRKPLVSRTPLNPMSDKRKRVLLAQGKLKPGSTFALKEGVQYGPPRPPLKSVSTKKAAAGNPRRSPRNTKPRYRNSAPGSSPSWRRVGSGLKPFPRKVQILLDRRDEWCQRCGSPGPLHRHHRRLKGSASDSRPHAQCACNGVRLCCVDQGTGEIGGCHLWVHLHPDHARDEGWIVSQEVDVPGRVSVMRGSEDGGGTAMFPTCSGEWVSECPHEAGEAA